jgi:hypothetical protein
MPKITYEGIVYARPLDRGVVIEEPEKILLDGSPAGITGDIYLDELAALAMFGPAEHAKTRDGYARLRITIERIEDVAAGEVES